MRHLCYAKMMRASRLVRGLNTIVAKPMLRHRTRPLIALGLAAAMLALTGCSTAQQLPYPKFSSVKRVTKKILTREEKDAAVQEMTLERTKQQKQAGQAPDAR